MTATSAVQSPPATRRRSAATWWLRPLPRRRVALLRVFVYGFVPIDVLLTTRWVLDHHLTPVELLQPLAIDRVLAIPVPVGGHIPVLAGVVVIASVLALTGRAPRLTGTAAAVAYLLWMLVAMSYGKVDHDRFALLVALAVLPTVGRARPGADQGTDEASGWALRMVQVAVMATYFLAAVAKLRYGGLAWLDSATLQRAVTRRGTWLGDALAGVPHLLHIGQYLIVGFELLSPLMLRRDRVGRTFLAGAVVLHVVTAATTGITFLPHVVCLAAFLPLERAPAWSSQPARPGTAAAPRASSPG